MFCNHGCSNTAAQDKRSGWGQIRRVNKSIKAESNFDSNCRRSNSLLIWPFLNTTLNHGSYARTINERIALDLHCHLRVRWEN